MLSTQRTQPSRENRNLNCRVCNAMHKLILIMNIVQKIKRKHNSGMLKCCGLLENVKKITFLGKAFQNFHSAGRRMLQEFDMLMLRLFSERYVT